MAIDYLLLATACPLPRVPTGFWTPESDSPPVSRPLVAGTTPQADLIPFWAGGFLAADISGGCGAGLYGVLRGLTFSAGSGLALNVAAGYCWVDGILYCQAQTVALANATRNYLWVSASAGHMGVIGTPRIVTTPPTEPAAYIGNVLTSGGSITSIDMSGVVFANGVGFRQTADSGAPGDSPPANCRLLTKTAGGIYLWWGGGHTQLA